MTTNPQVRDFTGSRRPQPRARVAMHSAADLLLTLWIVGDRLAESDPEVALENYDLGSDWFVAIDDGLSPELRDDITRIGIGEIWVGLLTLLTELPDNSTIEDFVGLLAGYDPVELRLLLLTHHDGVPEGNLSASREAAGGDSEAISAVLSLPTFDDREHWRHGLKYLLELEPSQTHDAIASIVRRFSDEVFSPHAAAFRPILERDAEAKRAMATRVSSRRLVEVATNGIDPSQHQRPILLIPHVVARPWVVFTDTPDELLLCYPVADEYMAADPDAPPQWLIKTYKALGDERRLRILRRLSRGPASLHELTAELNASKSTIHHHLMLLRSAGLIRVTIGRDKEYSLRKDVVPETTAILQSYIGGTESEPGGPGDSTPR